MANRGPAREASGDLGSSRNAWQGPGKQHQGMDKNQNSGTDPFKNQNSGTDPFRPFHGTDPFTFIVGDPDPDHHSR